MIPTPICWPMLAHALILRLGLMPAVSMRPWIRHQMGWKYGCIVTSRVCRTNTVTNDRHPKTMWRKNSVPAVGPEAEEAPEEFQPVGVGGHATDIHRRTVGEADMQLDIAEQPVLMFRNTGGSHLNVVCSRFDSHMGWINSTIEFHGQEP